MIAVQGALPGPEAGATRWRAVAVVTLGTVVLAACVLVVVRSMRTVMAVSGACGAGGSVPGCPTAVVPLMILGVPLGMLAAFLVTAAAPPARVPSPATLAWPALFCSLGWVFLEVGIDLPGGVGSAWGWVLSGLLFEVVGLVPLVVVAALAALPAPGQRAPAVGWVALEAAAVLAGLALGAALFGAVAG